VSFTTVYTFPNKSNNGKIALTIPSDLTVVSTGCTATIAGVSMLCGIAGKAVTATHSQTSSVAGQIIQITFASVTNPSSTTPTASFVMYSQEQVSGIYYSIDGVESGLTYAVAGLGSITSTTVVRDSLNTDNDGLKVGRNTNFLFTFTISNDVATDGVFTFIMPSESDALIDDTSSIFSCSSTDCSTGATVTCSVNNATRTVQITDYCTAASGRSCTGGSVINICLKQSFMKNMVWIKSPLLTTDSFAIKSGVSGGIYFIDGVTESITATPTLLPDALSFISPEIQRSSDTVSVKVEWTVYLKFSSNVLNQTGYLYMTLPDDVLYDMGEDLTVTLVTNSSASVTTSKTLYTSGGINVITFNGVCSTSGCAVDSLLTLLILWVKNPPAQTAVTNTITITSATADGWIIDQGTTAAVNSLLAELETAPITDISITPSDPSSSSATNYEIIFTADTDIPTGSYVVVTLPTELVVSATNAGGSTSLDTCQDLFVTTAVITCTIGTDANGQTTIKVEGLFTEAENSGQFGLNIGLIDNPSTSGDTGTFQFDIFSSTDNPIASKDIDTPVTILDPIADADCDSSCLTCSGVATSCDTCNVPSDLPFLQDNTCVSACSNGYFLVDKTCYQCHSSCSECSGYKDSNCLSCSTGFYFENGECVTE
jgi:hypothetical protein